MRSRSTYYLLKHKLAGFVMMAALLWLTVSAPFVFQYQQQIKKEAAQKQQGPSKSDDSSNPLGNTTEEQKEGGVNTLSEYLHDVHVMEHHYKVIATYYKCGNSKAYLAFHPETISPPPDSIS